MDSGIQLMGDTSKVYRFRGCSPLSPVITIPRFQNGSNPWSVGELAKQPDFQPYYRPQRYLHFVVNQKVLSPESAMPPLEHIKPIGWIRSLEGSEGGKENEEGEEHPIHGTILLLRHSLTADALTKRREAAARAQEVSKNNEATTAPFLPIAEGGGGRGGLQNASTMSPTIGTDPLVWLRQQPELLDQLRLAQHLDPDVSFIQLLQQLPLEVQQYIYEQPHMFAALLGERLPNDLMNQWQPTEPTTTTTTTTTTSITGSPNVSQPSPQVVDLPAQASFSDEEREEMVVGLEVLGYGRDATLNALEHSNWDVVVAATLLLEGKASDEMMVEEKENDDKNDETDTNPTTGGNE